jgi:hypothetical protein
MHLQLTANLIWDFHGGESTKAVVFCDVKPRFRLCQIWSFQWRMKLLKSSKAISHVNVVSKNNLSTSTPMMEISEMSFFLYLDTETAHRSKRFSTCIRLQSATPQGIIFNNHKSMFLTDNTRCSVTKRGLLLFYLYFFFILTFPHFPRMSCWLFGFCICERNVHSKIDPKKHSTPRVFRRDSPPTRSRRSIVSGGESSSMLTSIEGNAVQTFSKGNNFLPHCVA